jgi:glyoxylase-like metal-dependent hydrolase (beta-lactamase superfamily II)
MGRKLGIALGILVLALGVFALFIFNQVTSLESESVSGDAHVIFGLGGNVGVLATDRGAVVVDTMTFPLQGRRIRDLAEQLGGGPSQAVINTHYHGDHTHGNPAWPSGTKVIATDTTAEYLDHFDAEFWAGDAGGTAPNETFSDSHELRVGGKTVRSYHVGRGHTGGDLVVLFVEDRVLHAGDLFFNHFFPNIDLEAGGSVQQWGDTLDRVLELDFDRVIPGHGPITGREGLEGFARFIRQLAAVGRDAAEKGLTLEQTIAGAELSEAADYAPMQIPLILNLDRDFVIRRAWEEATGVVNAVSIPSN